jgi:uncharacterized protein involved in exopolysaccharide biosynthesis
MKLFQSELDTLAVYQTQLIEMQNQLRTFDLQVSEKQAERNILNELQSEFGQLHHKLSSLTSMMEKRIAMGAR